MRKFLLAAVGVAALLGVAGAATAQDQRPRGVFAMDANNDGSLTRQEFDAGRAARFAAIDADRNGQATREEMRAQRAAHRAERGEHGRRGGHRGMHLERADANNDGNITREEFLAAPTQRFARLDANSDGVISASERPQRGDRAQGERRERPNFDANNDRQFSRSEWDQMGASMFQRLDANSDSRVTQEEAQAARGHHRRGH